MLRGQRRCRRAGNEGGHDQITGPPQNSRGCHTTVPCAVTPCLEPDHQSGCRGKGQLEPGTEHRHRVDHQDCPGCQTDIAKRQAKPVDQPGGKDQHRHQKGANGTDRQARQQHIAKAGNHAADRRNLVHRNLTRP